jgi:hypothetical protein
LGQNYYSFGKVLEVFEVAIGEARSSYKVRKFSRKIRGPEITGFRYSREETGLITIGARYGARRIGGPGELLITL